MSLISLYGAARGRVSQGANSTLAGALLSKADDVEIVTALNDAYLQTPKSSPVLDQLEIMIAKQVDKGEALPIGEPDVMRGAQWLAGGNLTNLPDPMPRDFVLYLAHALVQRGKEPSMESAVKNLLANHTFF